MTKQNNLTWSAINDSFYYCLNNFHVVQNGLYFTHTFSIIVIEELKEKICFLELTVAKVNILML